MRARGILLLPGTVRPCPVGGKPWAMPGRGPYEPFEDFVAARSFFIAPVEPWCRENGSSVVISDVLEGLAVVGGIEIFPVFLPNPPPDHTPPPARAGGRSDVGCSRFTKMVFHCCCAPQR